MFHCSVEKKVLNLDEWAMLVIV